MKKGITLIELLVVLLIISLLIGIILRVMGIVAEKANRTKGVVELELLKHAIESFHDKYGVYPPTGQIEWQEKYIPPPAYLVPPDVDLGYSTGLVWYLFYNQDLSRPIWHEKFLLGVKEQSSTYAKDQWVTTPNGTYPIFWTNKITEFVDPWGSQYFYQVGPNPYQSYILIGAGPDTIINTVDDIGREWNE